MNKQCVFVFSKTSTGPKHSFTRKISIAVYIVKDVENSTNHVRHAGYWVLAVLFAVSVFLGIFAYAQFDRSEKHLTDQLLEFRALGETADVNECMDAVMNWVPQCSAMLSLCNDSVQRMMVACLIGQQRFQLCAEVETVRRRTSFGYAECEARGLDRRGKKACASIYRAIDKYCEELSKE